MPPLRLLKAPSPGKRMHAFGCCRCPLEQSSAGIVPERLQPLSVALCGDAAVARCSAVA
ncbi:MAG: hypothetical protein RRA60_04925 [Chlorobiota bacterium]|nr:hypothetical protein [Chlorobiota bacterium]